MDALPIAGPLAEFGIRVNCVAPGHIPTRIIDYDLGPTIQRDQPLQRQGSPEDVAEAGLFVAERPVRQVLLDQIRAKGDGAD